MALTQAGYDPKLGVDRYLLKKAREAGKPVIELESIEEQLNLVSGLNPADQESILRGSIEQIKGGDLPKLIERMISAWRAGDVAALQACLEENNAYFRGNEAVNATLIDGRNPAMTDKIAGLLREKRTIFVAVGALHLLGEQGLVALLKRRGYLARQL
jgi:uncharacterized protein